VFTELYESLPQPVEKVGLRVMVILSKLADAPEPAAAGTAALRSKWISGIPELVRVFRVFRG